MPLPEAQRPEARGQHKLYTTPLPHVSRNDVHWSRGSNTFLAQVPDKASSSAQGFVEFANIT